ncbi:YecH family metal-binding protein [Reinekea marinisedimentorum]|uniref:Putative metal-binding protein n=1 Tax=Reinekea marinisedimentorum TaxID=230495 RepID=A0A4R3ID50_9GAMM|nr:YecH family metal-binding protein [Reinekea marinisedimentorum]TCS43686.1 putative metal-binding protein [Reinekea marinisedimentorum]
MSSIHGHEVMNFMIESDESYTRETLIETIQQKFGAEAQFHTCSAEGMSAEALVDFLEQRGKFVPKADGFSTDASKVCNH